MEFKEVVKCSAAEQCRVITNRRVRVSKSRRLNYIKCWRASGLTRRQFCERYNINTKTFGRWLQSEEDERVYQVKPESVMSVSQKVLGVELRLPNGVMMYFRDGIERDCLASLVKEI